MELTRIASRKRPQCEPDVHRIASETVKSVRHDASGRIEWNGISAGAFLRDESTDVSAIPATKNNTPSIHRSAPCTKLVGDEPFDHERYEDRQNEEKRRRDRNAGTIFFRRQFGSHRGRNLITKFRGAMRIEKSEGRLRFRKRPSYLMAVSRILFSEFLRADDHLSQPGFLRSARCELRSHRDATIPEDQRTGCPPSVLSCTAWGFSCRANYFARGELLPRLFTLTCTFLKEPAVFFL